MTKLVDKMPITEHLNEFRKKLLVSLVAIFIGFIICFYYSEYLFYLLTLPLKKILKFSLSNPFIYFEDSNVPTINLVFLAPAEAFWMHMKIAAVSGIILVSPVILYELWGFVAPGLLPKEKRYIIPMMTVMTSLFLIGALFCFILVLPFAMQFLLTYKTETLKPMLSVGAYVDFCLKFILAFGA
ncbi:MAG: twin-arginine translocase subunit TatC, partial [Nitrospirae bacterium]|nr:twin-arginine translocase subunit TatC [Nitrospirota bacterium]